MKKRLYKVEQLILGGNVAILYFESKEQADGYVEHHNYCNHAGYICPNSETRSRLLDETNYYLAA